MSDAENNSPAAEEEKAGMNEHNEATSPEKEDKDVDKEEVKEEDEEVIEQKVQIPKKPETPKKSPKKPTKDDDEEDEEEEDDDDDPESDTPKLGLLEQPVVIESGKRAKKKVERLDMSVVTTPKDKKKLIPEGSGEKLGDCPIIEHMLQKTKAVDLNLMHKILFNRRPENAMAIRRNIRQFCGFDFCKGDKEYERKLAVLNKSNMAMLKPVCEVLDIERGGKKEELVERLMEFLLSPRDSGKKVPAKKLKRKSSGKKPMQKKEQKTKAKSASSEEDNEASDEEEKESEAEAEESEAEEEKESEEEPSEEESEAEVPQKKRKTQKKPVKKENAAKKKENGKKPPKKEKLPKVKSSPKKRKESDDSSDEDEPLIGKKKTSEPPSNEEIKDVIKKILEGANLEEITMKTVVKQVYGKYPQFDLADRKNFIKNTVKLIIS